MNFTSSIETCMEKYASFTGRASKSEFWWFYLFTLLIGWCASLVGTLTLGQPAGTLLSVLVNLALLLPSLAVSARRLHDTGRSGYWLFIGLTLVGLVPLLYWFAQKADPASNQYGPGHV
jgi:uncharacterized membrane protein YhaH (DUF805 family)